jgi:hypothetical protein
MPDPAHVFESALRLSVEDRAALAETLLASLEELSEEGGAPLGRVRKGLRHLLIRKGLRHLLIRKGLRHLLIVTF